MWATHGSKSTHPLGSTKAWYKTECLSMPNQAKGATWPTCLTKVFLCGPINNGSKFRSWKKLGFRSDCLTNGTCDLLGRCLRRPSVETSCWPLERVGSWLWLSYLLLNPNLTWIFPQPLPQTTLRPRRSQLTHLSMVTQVSLNLLIHPVRLVQPHQALPVQVQSVPPLIHRLPLVVICLASTSHLHDLVMLWLGEEGQTTK